MCGCGELVMKLVIEWEKHGHKNQLCVEDVNKEVWLGDFSYQLNKLYIPWRDEGRIIRTWWANWEKNNPGKDYPETLEDFANQPQSTAKQSFIFCKHRFELTDFFKDNPMDLFDDSVEFNLPKVYELNEWFDHKKG